MSNFSFIDLIIVEVEKSKDIEKTTYSWKSVNNDGSISTNYNDAYNTKISTRITYNNGNQDIVNDDLPLIRGWAVREIYISNELTYKICMNNKLIIYAKDSTIINTIATTQNFPEFESFFYSSNDNIKLKKDFVYTLLDNEKFYLTAEDKIITNVEKISMIEKNGNTYVNTRLYYTDNNSELFEKEDLAVLPGYHIREVKYGLSHHKNAEIIFSRFVFENKYHFTSNHCKGFQIYHPIYNNLHNKVVSTVEAKRKPLRFCRKTISFLNFILLFSSIILLKNNNWKFRETDNLLKGLRLISFENFKDYFFPEFSIIFSIVFLIVLFLLRVINSQKEKKEIKRTLETKWKQLSPVVIQVDEQNKKFENDINALL